MRRLRRNRPFFRESDASGVRRAAGTLAPWSARIVLVEFAMKLVCSSADDLIETSFPPHMTDKLLHFPVAPLDPSDPGPSGAAGLPLSAEQISRSLGEGVCPPDSAFDRYLPAEARGSSSQHWTPLYVAARAAEWLDEFNIRTVLDVGSGAGKFCVAAALAGHCHYTGLEQRERLVLCGRSLARTFDVEKRVHFIQGLLGAVPLPAVDAYYFYNPFEENVTLRSRIDADVELSPRRYARDLEAVRELLGAARSGTYVLTYNGLGDRLPASYQTVRIDRELPNVLRLWRKAVPRIVATGANVGSSEP
jgi:SAM-dependent methyltransferase